MKDMKYVMNAEEMKFVLIPDIGMNHSDIPGDWTSAGFVHFDSSEKDGCGNVVIKPKCYGKSVSLGLSCGENDQSIMEIAFKERW